MYFTKTWVVRLLIRSYWVTNSFKLSMLGVWSLSVICYQFLLFTVSTTCNFHCLQFSLLSVSILCIGTYWFQYLHIPVYVVSFTYTFPFVSQKLVSDTCTFSLNIFNYIFHYLRIQPPLLAVSITCRFRRLITMLKITRLFASSIMSQMNKSDKRIVIFKTENKVNKLVLGLEKPVRL